MVKRGVKVRVKRINRVTVGVRVKTFGVKLDEQVVGILIK